MGIKEATLYEKILVPYAEATKPCLRTVTGAFGLSNRTFTERIPGGPTADTDTT